MVTRTPDRRLRVFVFDEVFAAGARLSQREAVAAIRDRPATAAVGR